MNVWVKKDVLLSRSHSGRLKAWASSFNVWVPGRIQMNTLHEGFVDVAFWPSEDYARVTAHLPITSINVDKETTTKLIKAGLPLEVFQRVQKALQIETLAG